MKQRIHFGISRLIPAIVLLASSSVLMAQERRVIVERLDDKELRRSAHRLRLCADNLNNARQALQEATQMAPQIASEASISSLGQLWLRLDRSRAQGSLESLLDQLYSAAEQTAQPGEYQRVWGNAQQIIASLANLNPEGSEQYYARWEAAKKSRGISEPQHQKGRGNLSRSNQFHNLMRRDPSRALAQLPEQEEGGISYGIRGQLVQNLAMRGQQDEANALIDDTLALFVKSGLNSQTLSEFPYFLQQLNRSQPERVEEAIAQFEIAIQNPGPAGSEPVEIRLGRDETLQATAAERAVLMMIQQFREQPETALRLLETLPDLRMRLESVGGLDGFLSGGRRQAQRRFQDVRRIGRELENSDFDSLEERLSELLSDSADIQSLLSAGNMLCQSDPEKNRLFISMAAKKIAAIEDVSRAAQTFHTLISQALACYGELSPELLTQGYALVDQLRQRDQDLAFGGEQKGQTTISTNIVMPGGSMVSYSDQVEKQADRLETFLMASDAIFNFPKAMQTVRGHADEEVRFAALLNIVNLLTGRWH